MTYLHAANIYLTRYSRTIFTVLVIIAMCSFVKSIIDFWNVLHKAPAIATDTQTHAFPTVKQLSTLPDVKSITALGWFGQLPEAQIIPAEAAANMLSQFELKGISKSSHTVLAGAYIAETGKPEVYYRIGDALPGDIGTLAQIFFDHVAIRHGQALLILKFANPETTDINIYNDALHQNSTGVIPSPIALEGDHQTPAPPPAPTAVYAPLPVTAPRMHQSVTRFPVPIPPQQRPLPFPTQNN